jgi:Protein of unknown function (DUF2950)
VRNIQLSSMDTLKAAGEMKKANNKMHLHAAARAAIALFLAICLFASVRNARAQAAAQSTFSSPEDALQALVSAAKGKDRTALAKVFGADYNKLLTGDEVEDNKDLDEFSMAVAESAQLQKVGDSKFVVTVGKDNWPMPIPLVQRDGRWFFDTQSGLEEVLNRKVGENELSAIATCRAYAVAQWEYYTEGDWDHDGVAEYAHRLISTSGKHDGLFWETAEDDKPSPLGKLIAAARAEGYGPKTETPGTAGKGGSGESESVSEERAPYHGYYFKILTRQGAAAPGGKYSYVINGNMIAGYALVAYPDKWGSSGVMTFIINQQGRVYQKNLGPSTAKAATAMTEYNPDPTWKFVKTDQ